MKLPALPNVGGLAFVVWLLSPGSLACSAADFRPPAEIRTYDCGTIALHTLLVIEGRSLGVDELRARMPPLALRGRSIAELRDAARATGLQLVGVSLAKGTRAPDRPALVFFRRGEHGHFAVIRPVGHSGKLIQVIDIAEAPTVMDASDLYASPEWTGLALIPRRPNPAFVLLATLLAVSGSILLALLVSSWLRAWPSRRGSGPSRLHPSIEAVAPSLAPLVHKVELPSDPSRRSVRSTCSPVSALAPAANPKSVGPHELWPIPTKPIAAKSDTIALAWSVA
jgi:hypothetical protein